MLQVPGRRRPRSGHRDLRHHHRARPCGQPGRCRRRRAPLGSPAVIPAETGLGAGGQPAVADRGRPPGTVAGDPAAGRSAARRRRGRDRPSCLPWLSPGGAHRHTAGWRAGLPDLRRALARPAVRPLRSPPRARHPRWPGPAAVRQLPGHRPGEPGGLHRLRAPPPGPAADPARAAVLRLSHAAAADVLGLRPGHAVRHLPRHRPALVPGLPAPVCCLLGLRPRRADRLRHPGRPAVRRLHPAPGLGRLPGLQRPRPSEPRPVRPLPDQHAPGRADGSRRRLPAARTAGPAPRARRGRLPRHGDALADQPVHRPRAGRPCRRPHSADPPGPRRPAPDPGPGPSAADARRRRCPARPRRGNGPARGVPGRG